jgi:hypothetical protein
MSHDSVSLVYMLIKIYSRIKKLTIFPKEMEVRRWRRMFQIKLDLRNIKKSVFRMAVVRGSVSFLSVTTAFSDWNFSFCTVSISNPDLYIFVTNRLVVLELEIVAILCNIFVYHNFCNNAPI